MSARRPRDGKQRLFSIPPGTPFLPAFARALLEGRLVEGFPGNPSDPLALANATIYVPTRRAARALRSILVDMNPAKVLPARVASGFASGNASEKERHFADDKTVGRCG